MFDEFLNDYWVVSQVEGHLIFGLYAAKRKFFWIVINILLCNCMLWVINSPVIWNMEVFENNILQWQNLIIVFLILYFAYFSNFHQSVIFWVSAKFTLFLMALIFILVGVVDVVKGGNEWMFFLVLAVLWVPSLEFHSFFLRFQKIITIFRMLVTIFILGN